MSGKDFGTERINEGRIVLFLGAKGFGRDENAVARNERNWASHLPSGGKWPTLPVSSALGRRRGPCEPPAERGLPAALFSPPPFPAPHLLPTITVTAFPPIRSLFPERPRSWLTISAAKHSSPSATATTPSSASTRSPRLIPRPIDCRSPSKSCSKT